MLAWAELATGRTWLVLAASIALAAAGVGLAVMKLEFKSDRDELVDPSLPWQQRYKEFKRQFPRWSDAVVVIERPGEGGETTLNAFIEELAGRLRATGQFPAVTDGFPTSAAPPGLLLGEPVERVRDVAQELRRSAPVLGAPTAAQLISLTLLSRSLDATAREELTDLLGRLRDAAIGAPPIDGVLGASAPMQRLTTPDGDLAFVLVSLNATGPDGAPDAKVLESAIGSLRRIVREIQSLAPFRAVQGGVTGVPVLEVDEARQGIGDASRSTALAFVLIALLLFIVYRGVVAPLLALGALLLGVAWTFGYLTLAVGHLQLLSIVFAVILLGLGVDTAIHLIARLELVHPDHDHMPMAVSRTFRGVGPGILTSAMTTTAAFAATALTDFKGVAEMGLIAAGGVVLCTISVMTCFPAMLEMLPRPERRIRSREGGESKPFAGGALDIVDRRAPWFALLGAAVTVIAAWYGAGVRYDPDILKLMPQSIESVAWERRLEASEDRSVWHAVVMAKDLEEARRSTERLRAADQVSDVGDVGMLFPANLAEKQAILRSLPDPHAIDPAPPGGDVRAIAAQLAERWADRDAALAKAALAIADLSEYEVSRLESAYQSDREALRAQFIALRQAAPPSLDDLPEALRSLWIGRDGSLLLRVYPEGGEDGSSVLSPVRLNPFARAVLAAAPNATGPAIQIYESTRLIGRAYLLSALYAAVVIFALLLVDFRNIGDALSALAPVVVAAAMLAACLRFSGVSLNFANMIVLPLIVGLGVSAGVHATHRWRQQPHDRPAGLVGGSGRAVTLTILTTAIGFACMMIAEHRGIRSLGMVMSLGLGLVWVATVFLLPAILRLRTRDGEVTR